MSAAQGCAGVNGAALSQGDAAKTTKTSRNKSATQDDFSPNLRMRRLVHTDQIDLPARGRKRASLNGKIPSDQRDPGSVSHRNLAPLDGDRSRI